MTVRGKSAALRSNWTLKLAAMIALVLAVFATLLGQETPAATSNVKISDQVLNATAGGQEASFVIYLGDQADVSAAENIDGLGRARLVRLQHAEASTLPRTQAPIKAQLEARGRRRTSRTGRST